MKKIWIIILICILINLIIFFTGVLIRAINQGGNFMNWGTKLSKENVYIQKEEKIEITNLKEISFYTSKGDVEVILTDDKELRIVQYSNKELEEEEKFQINKSSDRIEIKENRMLGRFFSFLSYRRQLFEIYLPKEYIEDLEVQTVSGDLKIPETLHLANIIFETTSADIKIENEIKGEEIIIKSVSGDIRVGKIEGNKIQMKTTSGEIKSKETTANTIQVKSVSGDIELGNTKGEVEAKSTSGNIILNQFLIEGNSELGSVSGEITIYLAQESNCKIKTRTTSGNVKLPDGNSTIGKEPYYNLNIHTISGNIKTQMEKDI